MVKRMGASSAVCLVAFVIICCASQACSDASNHQYKPGEAVPFYANIAGPYRNPSETYAYNDLPFCLPDHAKEKKQSLGEVLSGHRLVTAPYTLDFLVEKDSEVACTNKLTKDQVSHLRNAIAEDFYFQMYYDDLPIWGFIGRFDRYDIEIPAGYKYLLHTHLLFKIFYNKEHVIEINVQTHPNFAVNLTEDKGVDLEFTYTVKWRETNKTFEKRMEKFYRAYSLPHHVRIHWFSVGNSVLTILILLGGLMRFYACVLKKDMNKYANDEELTDNQGEIGWKNIHGDVFRYPKHKSLFAAAIGSGTQLFVLLVFIVMLGLVGVFQPYSRGTLLTALVATYAVSSGIAGYTSVSVYCQLEGTNWVRNLLLTGCIFGGPLFITFCILNTTAIIYGATASVPQETILALFAILLFGVSPMLLLGGIAGKNTEYNFQAPCPTTKWPREIPPLSWYRGILPQMALAGMLPFGVIYIEIISLLLSMWGHKVYTTSIILFIVYAILVIMTAFVTVALTYSQLAAENHEWWWRSFLCGGSTGLFIYGYCLYYYHFRSNMSGFLQTSFYFGYMACICYGIFLMLGAIGFYASLLFVRHIYSSIKCE